MEKITIEVPKVGAVSDGYHTFDELYDHRITLYIALCAKVKYSNLMEIASNPYTPIVKVWRTKVHSDDSVWDGWFLLGIFEEPGYQITYHLPNDRWDECNFAENIEKAPDFDGHTSADVLKRIKTL